MTDRADLLTRINAELPDLDWKQGARDYVAAFCAQYTPEQIEEFIFTKPLAAVTPEDPEGALAEISSYLFNFASTIRLLNLKRGARVLDVACGGGWFSHWMRKIGYDARGIDISEDFVRIARKRVSLDPHLDLQGVDPQTIYQVHDLELEPLPQDLREFDAVVLESCLHHFYDPISALTHIREALAPGAVVLILEGENRQGPIKPEYLQVMLDTSTLERPYPREQLLEILSEAGLPHVEFLGSVSGYFAQSAWLSAHMTEHLADSTWGSNVCVCAPDAASLQRVVPTYAPVTASGPTQAVDDETTESQTEDLALPGPSSEAETDSIHSAKARGGFPIHPRAALRAGWRALIGKSG